MQTQLFPQITGKIDIFSVGDVWTLIGSAHNDVLYSGMDLMALMAWGSGRSINGMYLEFENGTDPAAISPPLLDVEAGVEYYLGLSGSRDYVRVSAGPKGEPTASSPKYKSNRISFSASSAHVVGTHGLPYSQAGSTVVYGAALVSLGRAPDDDIVFARAYLGPALRASKQDNMQIGIHWTSTIKHPLDV
jgi:hypothetical protein